ncbi:MAG TPA: VWA domain-containing protein [Acidobacteriaceae bacterium]
MFSRNDSSRQTRSRSVVSLLIAVIAAATGFIHAQTAAPAPGTTPQSTLTLNSRLVVLDVVVTDSAGKPVDGLNAGDFQVFEDGRLQRIQSFESPSEHTLPPASIAGGNSTVFDPAQPANFGHSPVNLLVLDQLNTHFADSSFARRSLHDYLAGQPALLPRPTSLLSVSDNGFRQLQPLTRDRDALLRALAATPANYAWNLELNGKAEHGPIERLDQSLRALEEIAQNYARIPGRKNLVWVGGGFPTLDPATIVGNDLQEVQDTLQHVTDVLLDARVTLYAVDPTSSAPGMTEVTDASQMNFVLAAGDGLAGNADPFGAGEDFDKLGPITGGRVLRGMNDVARQIASSVDLGERFYTISYAPTTTSESAAQYRNIRVVCRRPGLVATTRRGYYSGQTKQEKIAMTAAYDLSTAAQGAMPLHGIRVTVERDRSFDAPPDTYIVHAEADNLSWKPRSNGGAAASVYVMAVSLNAKGKMLDHTLRGMIATAKPDTNLHDPARTADFHFTALPAPKAATLRFIVRDSDTGRIGSFDLAAPKH